MERQDIPPVTFDTADKFRKEQGDSDVEKAEKIKEGWTKPALVTAVASILTLAAGGYAAFEAGRALLRGDTHGAGGAATIALGEFTAGVVFFKLSAALMSKSGG